MLFVVSIAAYAEDRDVRVLSYEPVELEFQAPQGAGSLKSASFANAMRFSAFGKSYRASLTPNASIEIPAGSSAQAYKGSIDDRADSWVRITRIGEQVHGLIFDGAQLFALEPAEDIGANAPGTALFRLADTETDLGAEFCSTLKSDDEQSGLALFKSLGNESKSIFSELRKSGARTRLQISVLIDLAFRARYGSDAAANDAVVTRINNVDGIFTSQLGMEVELTTTIAPETPSARVFNSSNPDTLLQTVARVRSESPALYAAGITHLFTGADMDGKTVGIAYMDSVCGQRYAASLSEVRDRGAWYDSLVAAHEIGHSFGSPHDGENECAATPTTYLMSPIINGNDRFSQCTLNRVQTRIQTASCLVPIPVGDISLPGNLAEHRASLGTEFAWAITVANTGNAESTGSRLEIAMPASLNVRAARVNGGTCSFGAGVVVCELGTMAVREIRPVELTLSGLQIGHHTVTATATANTDFSSANNVAVAAIRIDPSVDIALSLTTPSAAAIDQVFAATFAVANRSTSNVTNVAVNFAVPSGMILAGLSELGGTACQLQSQTLRCSTASLAAGRTLSGSISLAAREAGTKTLTATLDGDFVDPQPVDNTVQKSIDVTAPAQAAIAGAAAATAEAPGGGSLSVLLLLLLSSVHGMRRRHSLHQ